MKSNTPIDFAIFQLSPRRSRCELFVSSAGNTEKLASGLVKPFLTHLKVAEEQAASTVQSIKLEVERFKNAETWFTKGTLERFVRFVSTPEVLELVNTFDAEMSQLEAARRIYSQGAGDQLSSSSGGDGAVAAADATKKELLRAIDVRLVAVRQDLTTSYTRAAAAGFTLDAVSELQLFADQFGASRLNEACSKFISLCDRRPDLINPWKTGLDDRTVRSSCGSDMSIDDDPPDELRCGPQQDLEESKPTTWQQPTKPTVPLRRSRESSVDRDEVKENEEKKEQNANQEEPVQTAQLTRRLSVQDRINLFENKQKETTGGSGSKLVVGKSVELRRLSSDVSSAPAVVEKAVLRRWSGASDMSIDLGGEKKEIESPLRTPSSSSVSQAKSEDHESKGVTKQDEAIETKVGLDSGATLTVSLGFSQDTSESTKLTSSLERVENDVWKYQTGNKAEARTQIQSRPFRAVDDSLKHPVVSQTQSRPFVDARAEQIGSTDQRRFKTSFASDTHGGNKEQVSSERQLVGNMGSRGQSASQSRPVEIKENIGNPLASQAQWGSSGVEEGKKAWGSSEKQSVNFATGAEHGPERMKIQKQVSVSEQNKRPHAIGPVSSIKMASESQEDSGTISTFPAEQVQRVRQAKGNQELNDELKMKANELEKLFAEHKLRVPLEQSSSAKRNRTADIQIEQEASRKLSAESAPAYLPVKNMVTEPLRGSSNVSSDCVTPPVKLSDNQNYGDSLKENFSAPGLSDDSRGKFYDKYMQKRDAKLREEWGSKRAEKEAKMKTIHDSFERSRKEMKTKFAGSSDKKDLVLSAYQRAERLRSFNTRSAMKREQHPIEYLQGDGEDLTDLAEMTPLGHVRSLSETSLGDSAARSAQIRRPLPSRNLPTSTPRMSAAPVPKSAAKASNTISGRRRMQSENPLAQSVPNFSDFRKENTKPSSGVSKPTRLQARNHARSRSTNEDIPLVKEEKSRRSQSLRKSSAGPVEFKQFSSMDSDGVGSNPLNKEQNEVVTKDMESKPFLRKGNGIGPGAGAVIAKMKASMASDEFEHEESDAVKYEEEEESEVIITEDYSEMDNEKRRLSEDSDKLANSDSESGDALRSFSKIDPSFATEASTFHPTGSLQDSPTESPVSWNSRIQNAFAYAQETSDVDASADSPLGSPASWNSHSLNQAEADAAHMRKKWGSAQKPFLVSNSSVGHPRKDVTKGFKRLLKFGRKSRGTDNLVDWISATTSEGDDDTEDGRDPGNRSSEDLRKSRMGFPQSHPSDDCFNESDFYTEQVQTLRSSIPAPPAHFKLREDSLTGSSIKAPRSFFSLSSFRSKASDSKPR